MKEPSPKKNKRQGPLRRRSPSPVHAAAPEDTFGWISDVPDDWKITGRKAKEAYYIKDKHLKEITADQYDDCKLRTTYPMYKEQDVEWKAWVVHGGPVGLWHYLRACRENHLKTHGDDVPFPVPYGYRSGRRYDLDLDSPPSLPDRFSAGSEVLQWCKDRLPCWLWERLNGVLNDSSCQCEHVFGLAGEREQAMVAAVQFFDAHPEYAHRPAVKFPMCLQIASFRATLIHAPKAPPRDDSQWGENKTGMVFICASERPEDGYYEWDVTYLERIFRRLLESIRDLHQVGTHDAWKTLRWELYDQYSQKVGRGLRYDPKTESWSDPAAEWLQVKMTPERLHKSLRGMCNSGGEYNDMLPESDPPPDTAPVPGSSSAPA